MKESYVEETCFYFACELCDTHADSIYGKVCVVYVFFISARSSQNLECTKTHLETVYSGTDYVFSLVTQQFIVISIVQFIVLLTTDEDFHKFSSTSGTN